MDENQVAGIDRSEDMYRNYNQIKFNKLFTAYQNKESNEVLFLLRGKKVPNPLDLGKLLNPKPIDRIIAGYLPFPSKIFSVQNRVEENRVSNFKYKNKNIVSIEFIDFPFKTIRSFDYDVSGYCIGYIDSLFANEEYLTKSRTQFVLNQFHAPNSVVHFKKNKESKMGLDYVVNFQYVLYP